MWQLLDRWGLQGLSGKMGWRSSGYPAKLCEELGCKFARWEATSSTWWPREHVLAKRRLFSTFSISDMPHAKRTMEVVLKLRQRHPVYAGNNHRRMLCYVAPQLLPGWQRALASAPCWCCPYSAGGSMENLKCQNFLFLIGIKSYNNWTVMSLPFLSFSPTFSLHPPVVTPAHNNAHTQL